MFYKFALSSKLACRNTNAEIKKFFFQVGRQYELENEEELKDKLDFQVVKHFESVLGKLVKVLLLAVNGMKSANL